MTLMSSPEMLEKPAITDCPVHPMIEARWSPRAFDERPLAGGQVCSLLEAARWAPSCFNEQPWRFFVGSRGQSPEALAILQDLLVPQNQIWANKAPVLMLMVAKLNFTYNGQPNRHGVYDCGSAMENLVLQAQFMGLVTHQMAGFDDARAVDVLGIPPGHEPMAMVVVGYPGQVEDLPNEDLKRGERSERSRKPLQELCFSTHWEQVYSACFSS